MKKLVIGILAHVDAGKTTLSEAMLYKTGAVRRLGRVDHKDAFLDTNKMERDRGITIFSKQACFTSGKSEITLLDTPGHVDFSSETERVLQVLDYAVLLVSATDGIQAHTVTLWQLLARYRVPTFIFINKCDLPGHPREELIAELQARLGGGCIDFGDGITDSLKEQAAICDEELLELVLSGENGEKFSAALVRSISERKIFPCCFGAALKLEGVDTLLSLLDKYTLEKHRSESFGAKVFKISRDENGKRLTHMKITGGELKAKAILSDDGEEKVDIIRIYSGEKYKTADRARAGEVCAVLGLERTYPGQGLGTEMETNEPILEPVLNYRVCLPKDVSPSEMYPLLKQLEEEDPQLHVVWNERIRELHVRIMGEVQLEVLSRIIDERYGVSVSFDEGGILYKETIVGSVEGVGHFEPLRHYAEVHLLLEAGAEGSGLCFDSLCSENQLDRNWQRLVLTHLYEKCHIGVLTGSPITDMRISLISGKAHKKHTVGGDFRQATYRAVRQGLMQAKSVLLEPYYSYRLSIPRENLGRAMTDISRMCGTASETESDEETAVLCGEVPVSSSRGYAAAVSAYSKGRGRFSFVFSGYKKCHNPEEVIEALSYDAEGDLDNTADSVFCAHGAGFNVKWDRVSEYMHIEGLPSMSDDSSLTEPSAKTPSTPRRRGEEYEEARLLDRELLEIFERTYGPIKPRKAPPEPKIREFSERKERARKPVAQLPEYVLVDGYNIIFAWDELKKIASDNLNLARQLLINILCNYQGCRDCGLILVFDAYKVAGGKGSIERHGGIDVVYTKEAETADAYIERVTYEMGKKYRVRVATSDNLEQIIILGHGAERVPARAFFDEVCKVRKELDEEIEKINRQK